MSKDQLLESLIKRKYLKTSLIIEAFENIDRKDFVLPEYRDSAYFDKPLPIGYGMTISQPLTVAFMLELLEPRPGDKVLDVGSGSGWTSALLAYIVGKSQIANRKSQKSGIVIGVERIPELVEFGRKNLEKYKFANAKLIPAGEKLGFLEEAPYDKILVSAASDSLPQELVNQLKIEGRMVISIKNSIWKIDKVSEKEIKKEEYQGFNFVTLVRN